MRSATQASPPSTKARTLGSLRRDAAYTRQICTVGPCRSGSTRTSSSYASPSGRSSTWTCSGRFASRPARARARPPHTGLATISHLLEGEGWHGDDLGNEVALTAGSVNWMASGRGIVHNEGLSERFSATGGPLTGIQAWLLLTPEERQALLAFLHTPAEQLPTWRIPGFRLTLVSGRLSGREVATTTARPHAAILVEAEDVDQRAVTPHGGVRGASPGHVELRLDAGSRAILLAGERRLGEARSSR